MIKAGETQFGLDPVGWKTLAKGDWRKGLVAGLIRASGLVPNGWVAKRLSMGAPGAVRRTIREARELAQRNRKIRSQLKRLEGMFNSSDWTPFPLASGGAGGTEGQQVQRAAWRRW